MNCGKQESADTGAPAAEGAPPASPSVLAVLDGVLRKAGGVPGSGGRSAATAEVVVAGFSGGEASRTAPSSVVERVVSETIGRSGRSTASRPSDAVAAGSTAPDTVVRPGSARALTGTSGC